MRRIRSPRRCAPATRRWGIRSSISIARTATDTKPARLQEGLKTATGEFVAVFDADFIPPADFLERTIHYFTDPKVGVVQTRWTYLNRHYNVLTEVEAMLLDGHFVLEHGARFGGGLFFNFNGTAGILRREMIDDAGGWQHDTLTEDSDLSYRAQIEGLEVRLYSRCRVPVGVAGRDAWLPGAAVALVEGVDAGRDQAAADHPQIRLPRRVKMEAIFHLTPNISYPL